MFNKKRLVHSVRPNITMLVHHFRTGYRTISMQAWYNVVYTLMYNGRKQERIQAFPDKQEAVLFRDYLLSIK